MYNRIRWWRCNNHKHSLKMVHLSWMKHQYVLQFLATNPGSISRIRPALRKSYSSTHTTPSSRFMQELETLTQRVNDKDNAISELTQCLEQQALLIQSLVARMDMSEHPPIGPTNDHHPPPPPSTGAAVNYLLF